MRIKNLIEKLLPYMMQAPTKTTKNGTVGRYDIGTFTSCILVGEQGLRSSKSGQDIMTFLPPFVVFHSFFPSFPQKDTWRVRFKKHLLLWLITMDKWYLTVMLLESATMCIGAWGMLLLLSFIRSSLSPHRKTHANLWLIRIFFLVKHCS